MLTRLVFVYFVYFFVFAITPISFVFKDGQTVLHKAASLLCGKDLVRYLIDCGADVNVVEKVHCILLSSASRVNFSYRKVIHL
jgi:hypothetical protein